MQALEVGRCLHSGRGVNRASTSNDKHGCIAFTNHDGVVSMDSQVEFVPNIQVCGTHGREDLVNATITLNAEEEEVA